MTTVPTISCPEILGNCTPSLWHFTFSSLCMVGSCYREHAWHDCCIKED